MDVRPMPWLLERQQPALRRGMTMAEAEKIAELEAKVDVLSRR